MNAFQFANPQILLGLLVIPPLCVFLLYSLKKRLAQLSNEIDSSLLTIVAPRHLEAAQHAKRFIYTLALSIGLLILALARPQWGYTWKESSRQGIDLVFAVDVSESMLAEDIRPNRLTRAKRELTDILERLRGDRVALVSFAGAAYLETPLTLDYGALRSFLQTLNTDLVPIKGTNIDAAVQVSIQAFSLGEKKTEKSITRERALILVTDGENFMGNLESLEPTLKENNIHLFVLGIGTKEGAPIPSEGGYKRDKAGKMVLSKLNPERLQILAQQSGGIYVGSVNSEEDTEQIYTKGIKQLLKDERIAYGRSKQWNEYFQLPLFIGLALLAIAFYGKLFSLPVRKRASTGVALLSLKSLLFAFWMLQSCWVEKVHAESPEDFGASARKFMEAGEFKKAFDAFTKGAEQHPNDFRLKLGQGAALYRMNDYNNALEAFLAAERMTEDKQQKSRALYNAANSAVQLDKVKEAVEWYKQALSLSPQDQEIKDNLAYAKKILPPPPPKDSSEKNKEKNKEEDKEKQENQEQQESEQSDSSDSSSGDQSENQEEQGRDREREREQGQGQGKEQEQEQEKEKEQEQGQEKEKEEGQSGGGKPEQSEQSEPKSGSGKQSQEAAPAGSALEDQLESQLEAIEETSVGRMKFRFKKGLEQLEEQKYKIPEEDW